MSPATLEFFFTSGILAFILAFVRIGSAVMIMPGVGDSFVPAQIRLVIAVAFTLVFFPIVLQYIPNPLPGPTALVFIIIGETLIGLFFGSVARIFMMALDTAGMVVSLSSGLSNAQLFNPALATQGSLVGAFLSVSGIVVLFALDLHHLLIAGIIESYELFPLASIPEPGSMAEMIARSVSQSFAIGVKIAAPFMVLILLTYTLMGVLARLMPQVQVFILALPIQILMSLLLLSITVSAMYMFWAREFEQVMVFFLSAPN